MSNSDAAPNKLIHETSPYLLQHAYNPVNWYPWGEEAFHKAKTEGKPIFLSIGYSTCHWCHVMAHESFEDEQVAKRLNAGFVSIKVDREERPDIDAVYMDVCQTLTGSGGWPLTVFLTPEQIPFFAGTYFPKSGRYGRPGFLELLDSVAYQWEKDPGRIENSGREIVQALSTQAEKYVAQLSASNKDIIPKAVRQLSGNFDPHYGGFGNAPKFPMPHNLMFLLCCYLRETETSVLEIVRKTLDGICCGGIFDHIGFGFSRYSTDQKWLAPHFEKMLYDNALMTLALLEFFRISGESVYRDVACRTLEYVRREMTSPEGGFYSAQDADSDGEEGKYYTFSEQEVIDLLGKEAGTNFCMDYNFSIEGNFEGKNIPNRIGKSIFPENVSDDVLAKLYRYRLERFPLHKDDKILTSWTSLMIAAYAKAFQITGKAEFLEAAERALSFVNQTLRDENGLCVSYRNGKVSGAGLLDDYAFLCWACLELFEATQHLPHLSQALFLAQEAENCFADSKGGFFMNQLREDKLIFRPKQTFDGALPSGNSVFLFALQKLAALTGEERWRTAADKQLDFLLPELSASPAAHTFALMALIDMQNQSREMVCVAQKQDVETLLQIISKKPRPGLTTLIKTDENSRELAQIAPFTQYYSGTAGQRFTFYLCENHACSAPFFTIDELEEKLS